MNIICQEEVMDKFAKLLDDTEVKYDFKTWGKMNQIVAQAYPYANPVLDSIHFRTALLKAGYNFEQIRDIMNLVHENSINRDFCRVDHTAELLADSAGVVF